MTLKNPLPGQRWVSDSEPELGLGIILTVGQGRLEILFPAAEATRQYSLKSSPPLRRVQYKEGDTIRLHDGSRVVVAAVAERDGTLVYETADGEHPEALLSDTISFSHPEDRLLAGQVDDLFLWDLRVGTLQRRARLQSSPVRGFVGGRVDLIPHQLSIAGEVAPRLTPRVLLADEVGLGKTIEAGLILARLHLTGRAERILILVPEPLVNQWFIELLRRFQLLFSIFDEERCEGIEFHHPGENPFLDSQLIICATSFLAGDPARALQAGAAGCDLLVVDEAHHLAWSPGEPSAAYTMVEGLAQVAGGLLLLTATPQQLGPEGHFARLRLLDPDRYSDLAAFTAEAAHYEEVAGAVDRLLARLPPSPGDKTLFTGHSARVRRGSEALAAGDETARAELVSTLLDSFGTGRVMFRNTRAALAGFPERRALLAPLEAGEETARKVKWLVLLLRTLGEEKVLLICHSRALAEQIVELLGREIKVPSAVFHEGLTLIQRDRNAAYFSEEEGARVLICSEIGSEGRNFQFAHHLVLWDLPRDPELLEQRIGRLDRIGQRGTIHIHVPYLPGSAGEVLARWYHEGLQAFETNLHGASEIARALAPKLEPLLAKYDAKALARLIVLSVKERARVAARLERGYDRLLALNSCQPARAEVLAKQIRGADADTTFEPWAINLFDLLGVVSEELAPRTYHFRPSHGLAGSLPALPPDGFSATFDRQRALSRDDLGFMTGDHPLVRGALDALAASESGNAAFGLWKVPGPEAMLLEICALVDCVAPAALHVDRFLPPTPLRVVVDHAGTDFSQDAALAGAVLVKGDIFRLLDRAVVKQRLIPAMLASARALADAMLQSLIGGATSAMSAQIQREIDRLEDLRELNPNVTPEEIAALHRQRETLTASLAGATVRLDGVRLILRSV